MKCSGVDICVVSLVWEALLFGSLPPIFGSLFLLFLVFICPYSHVMTPQCFMYKHSLCHHVRCQPTELKSSVGNRDGGLGRRGTERTAYQWCKVSWWKSWKRRNFSCTEKDKREVTLVQTYSSHTRDFVYCLGCDGMSVIGTHSRMPEGQFIESPVWCWLGPPKRTKDNISSLMNGPEW